MSGMFANSALINTPGGYCCAPPAAAREPIRRIVQVPTHTQRRVSGVMNLLLLL